MQSLPNTPSQCQSSSTLPWRLGLWGVWPAACTSAARWLSESSPLCLSCHTFANHLELSLFWCLAHVGLAWSAATWVGSGSSSLGVSSSDPAWPMAVKMAVKMAANNFLYCQFSAPSNSVCQSCVSCWSEKYVSSDAHFLYVAFHIGSQTPSCHWDNPLGVFLPPKNVTVGRV